MILLEDTTVKYRDGTVKTLNELGGEVSELAPDTPVKNGSTSKPLDEFIQDQIVLAPETPVVDGEDTMTLDEFVEDSIESNTDPVPTESSINPVSSGGVYYALAGKVDKGEVLKIKSIQGTDVMVVDPYYPGDNDFYLDISDMISNDYYLLEVILKIHYTSGDFDCAIAHFYVSSGFYTGYSYGVKIIDNYSYDPVHINSIKVNNNNIVVAVEYGGPPVGDIEYGYKANIIKLI